MNLETVSDINSNEFVERFVARNQPVVVRDIPFSSEQWVPDSVKKHIGDLAAQIYDSLFDLENITSLEEYIDDYFGSNDQPYRDDVPYVRWYNQLKDIEFAWGDEAFERMSQHWKTPNCIPTQNLIVPVLANGKSANPVTDCFPYRALQVAARGARTRLHRDPFCSEAVVSQFYGTKLAALYRPERAQELMNDPDSTSFGGFLDVRKDDLNQLSHEPDFLGEIVAGDMIFIPHGWLHEVIVVEDSISVTWNFVHAAAAQDFQRYLKENPESDSEFEVLQYFYGLAGHSELSPPQVSNLVVEALKTADRSAVV